MKELQEKEKLLVKCEKDLKRIRDMLEEIKMIESNRIELYNYYTNQYMEDYEVHQYKKHNLRVLDQDSIWNVLDDIYHQKINLVKNIIQSI